MSNIRSENPYNFKDSNKVGTAGEDFMLELFPTTFTKFHGHAGDLILKNKQGSHKFELKTDRHDSGNFFFEKISNERLNNVGGVWQSKEHGCKYYSFYMIKYDKLCIFEVDTILEWLNKNTTNMSLITVYNTTKKTLGYKIHIKKVKHLCEKIIDLNTIPNYKELKVKYNFAK